MDTESKLLKILIEKTNSKDISSMANKLESNSKFNLKSDIEKLKGIWELRWSSSNSPILSYSPLPRFNVLASLLFNFSFQIPLLIQNFTLFEDIGKHLQQLFGY